MLVRNQIQTPGTQDATMVAKITVLVKKIYILNIFVYMIVSSRHMLLLITNFGYPHFPLVLTTNIIQLAR